MFLGEHRGGVIAGNTRSSSERGRISAYSGASDHADSMDNPSSREDISEMYALHTCMRLLKRTFSLNCFNPVLLIPIIKKHVQLIGILVTNPCVSFIRISSQHFFKSFSGTSIL